MILYTKMLCRGVNGVTIWHEDEIELNIHISARMHLDETIRVGL